MRVCLLVLLAYSTAGAQGPAPGSPQPAELADHYGRLVEHLQSYRIRCRLWRGEGDHRQLLVEQESSIDGRRRRYHVIHFPPGVETAELAERLDEQVNDFIYDGENKVIAYQNRREFEIIPEPLPPPTSLDLGDFARRLSSVRPRRRCTSTVR